VSDGFSEAQFQQHPMKDIRLPSGWALVALSAIADDVSPGFASGQHTSDGSGVPHLRPMNVDREGYIDLQVVKSVASTNGVELREGDVLFNNTNSAELVGKTALVSARQNGFAFSNHMTRVRLEPRISANFIARQLHFLWMSGYMRHRCTNHVNQASISSKTLADTVPILLPPDREQVRIVEKLEELLSDLDAGVAELKAAQRKLAQYRQSLLKAAVEGALTAEWRRQNPPAETGAQLLERLLRERRQRWEAKQLARFQEQGKTPPKGWQDKYPEPVQPDTGRLPNLPEGWAWASVDQLATMVRNGLSQKPSPEPVGFPILRINAVRSMSVDLEEVRYLNIDQETAADYVVDEGDLLATRYNGSVDLLGVFGMVRGVTKQTLHPDKLIRIKLALGGTLAEWVEICAAVGASRLHVISRVRTTAGQTGISGEDIKKMPIPLAPLEEQTVIVAAIAAGLREIRNQACAVDTSMKQSAAQCKNILKAAFSGQLVPQDPNDEPASALLARIRAERAARVGDTKRRGRRAEVEL